MKILVVEDEHQIAAALKKGLEQEKYVVTLAYDGEAGLDTALDEDPDLIILDWLLPKMDGLDVCRGVRKAGKHTPILMLTARGQTQNKVAGLNAGADDYLTKPFAFEELLARIHALTRRSTERLDTILKTGDLELNPTTFEVRRAKKAIQLSNREFSLLEYLLSHAGQILTKERIISHLWSYDADILPNTVEVYIGFLRNKIDRPFKGPALITTVRGFGYKIEKL